LEHDLGLRGLSLLLRGRLAEGFVGLGSVMSLERDLGISLEVGNAVVDARRALPLILQLIQVLNSVIVLIEHLLRLLWIVVLLLVLVPFLGFAAQRSLHGLHAPGLRMISHRFLHDSGLVFRLFLNHLLDLRTSLFLILVYLVDDLSVVGHWLILVRLSELVHQHNRLLACLRCHVLQPIVLRTLSPLEHMQSL